MISQTKVFLAKVSGSSQLLNVLKGDYLLIAYLSMDMSRIILGIDPGTAVTGYGIISCEGKKMSLISCGVIHVGKYKLSHAEKLKKIFERTTALIKEYKPHEMAVEAPFQGKNIQATLKLGRAQGVAMTAAMIHDLPVFEYAPRKVKLAVTGRGTASKEQVASMLVSLFTFEEKVSFMDATDGLAVAVCHFYQGNAIPAASGKKGWSSFLKDNPNRIKKR